MDIEIIDNTTVLTGIFEEVYNHIKGNTMSFQSSLLIDNEKLVFTLKDPKRLFIVSAAESTYGFKMEDDDTDNEGNNFEYVVYSEEDALDVFSKLVKRQAI